MKKMEMKAIATFMLVYVIGVLIMGLYSVTQMQSKFFNYEVFGSSIIFPVIYFLFLWINTRKYKLLALTGVFNIGLLFFLVAYSLTEERLQVEQISCNWIDIIIAIYMIIIYGVSRYQGEKLIKEAHISNC